MLSACMEYEDMLSDKQRGAHPFRSGGYVIRLYGKNGPKGPISYSPGQRPGYERKKKLRPEGAKE